MTAAVIALVWANSPWQTVYLGFWHTPIGLRFGSPLFERDLRFWINDGLMTVFFFVVGLEVRREIHSGELSEGRRAALPLAAAVGGMIVPALIFLALNAGRGSAAGWAVPMATDIAFAVGALALLGKRVAPALRILLLALAVIDDIGAIVVIALFYSTNIVATGFAILILGILVTFVFQFLGVRSPLAYIIPGVITWAGAYYAGIHPTLAGVIMGLMTPVSSAERLQHLLHGWVAFGIMPLFAFANAGVPLGQVRFAGDAWWLFCGVLLALAIGKPVGIVTVSWLAVRLRWAALPNGVHWPHVAVVGMVGGIGFTMALFIAQLAFPEGSLLETSKLAILCGSVLAGALSLFAGHRILSR
jgi:NhaA family Na+:H+ antiporter